jgi:hypothetical protein
VNTVLAARSGTEGVAFSWTPVAAADLYTVSRGALTGAASNDYGACIDDALVAPAFTDDVAPAPSAGWLYLFTAVDGLCGPGTAGYSSTELPRHNTNALACP